MKKWEYKVLRLTGDEETELNECGDRGWELAAMVYDQTSARTWAYFKREVPSYDETTPREDSIDG